MTDNPNNPRVFMLSFLISPRVHLVGLYCRSVGLLVGQVGLLVSRSDRRRSVGLLVSRSDRRRSVGQSGRSVGQSGRSVGQSGLLESAYSLICFLC